MSSFDEDIPGRLCGGQCLDHQLGRAPGLQDAAAQQAYADEAVDVGDGVALEIV